MKKLSILVLSILLIMPFIFLSGCEKKDENVLIDVWDESKAEVSKPVNNLIEIDSAEELAGLAKEVNNGNSFDGITFKLMIDIDLLNRKWIPIGYCVSFDLGNSFNGCFDGQNHTIYNLNVKSAIGAGLFGFVNGEIKNLNVKNANVIANSCVGVVAGNVVNGNINNCHVRNASVNSIYLKKEYIGDKAGSIAGRLKSSNIINCSAVEVVVGADSEAGQLVGVLNDCDNFDFITNNKIQRVEVLYNKTGRGLEGNSGRNIKNKFFGVE